MWKRFFKGKKKKKFFKVRSPISKYIFSGSLFFAIRDSIYLFFYSTNHEENDSSTWLKEVGITQIYKDSSRWSGDHKAENVGTPAISTWSGLASPHEPKLVECSDYASAQIVIPLRVKSPFIPSLNLYVIGTRQSTFYSIFFFRSSSTMLSLAACLR